MREWARMAADQACADQHLTRTGDITYRTVEAEDTGEGKTLTTVATPSDGNSGSLILRVEFDATH